MNITDSVTHIVFMEIESLCSQNRIFNGLRISQRSQDIWQFSYYINSKRIHKYLKQWIALINSIFFVGPLPNLGSDLAGKSSGDITTSFKEIIQFGFSLPLWRHPVSVSMFPSKSYTDQDSVSGPMCADASFHACFHHMLPAFQVL